MIEEELKICVAGYFPDYNKFHIESRHLGLVMPDELTAIKKQLQMASEELKKTVSTEMIIRIAEEAEELRYQKGIFRQKNSYR